MIELNAYQKTVPLVIAGPKGETTLMGMVKRAPSC